MVSQLLQTVCVAKQDGYTVETINCDPVKNGECEELIKTGSWRLTSGPAGTWRQEMEGLHFVLLISHRCKCRGSWSDCSGVQLARLASQSQHGPAATSKLEHIQRNFWVLSFQTFDTFGPPDISKLSSQLASLFFLSAWRNKSLLCLQEPVGLRLPARDMKYFTVFSADCSWLLSFQQKGFCCQCHQLGGLECSWVYWLAVQRVVLWPWGRLSL